MNSQIVMPRLQKILREHFGKPAETLTPEATLRGTLMMDSLDLVDLGFYIRREFEVHTSVTDVRSLQGLAERVLTVMRTAA